MKEQHGKAECGMEPDRFEETKAILERCLERYRKRHLYRRILSFPFRIGCFLLIWMPIAWLFQTSLPANITKLLLYSFGFGIILTFISLQYEGWIYRREEREATEDLARSNNTQAAALLLQVIKRYRMFSSPTDITSPAWLTQSLASMLLRLDAAELVRFHDSHKEILYQELKRAVLFPDVEDVNLAVAILEVVETIGDQRILPTVEKFCQKKVGSDERTRIQEKALECLPRLKTRIERLEQEERLLRPVETPSDTLLRPVYGPQESSGEQLLRPYESQ